MMGWFSAVIERRTLLGWAIVAIVGAVAAATLLALAGPSFGAPENTDPEVQKDLAALRQETRDLRDLNNVVNAQGNVVDDEGNVYVRPGRCVPQMGWHYVVRNNVLDEDPPAVGIGSDPLKFEALLYAPDDTGALKLVAVEWIVRDADQYLTTENVPRPELFGQAFDGPMWGHEPWVESPYHGELEWQEHWMPIHYELHAWIWKSNPNGVFEGFNPNVSCSPTSG
jgi:hypothetical protein